MSLPFLGPQRSFARLINIHRAKRFGVSRYAGRRVYTRVRSAAPGPWTDRQGKSYHTSVDRTASPRTLEQLNESGLPFLKDVRTSVSSKRGAVPAHTTTKLNVAPRQQRLAEVSEPDRSTTSRETSKGKERLIEKEESLGAPEEPVLRPRKTSLSRASTKALSAFLNDKAEGASSLPASITKIDAYRELRRKEASRVHLKHRRRIRINAASLVSLAEEVARQRDATLLKQFLFDLQSDAAVEEIDEPRPTNLGLLRFVASRTTSDYIGELNRRGKAGRRGDQQRSTLAVWKAESQERGAFGILAGSVEMEEVLGALLRALVSEGLLRRTCPDRVVDPIAAAKIVRLAWPESGSPEEVPAILTALPREEGRRFLSLLAQEGSAHLFGVIESLRRRLEGGRMRRQSPDASAQESDFPTLSEAADLVNYYLQAELQRPAPGRPLEQPAQSALKVYRGLVAAASPLRRAGLTADAANGLLVDAKREATLLLRSVDGSASISPAANTSLTYRLTLRLAILRLLLRHHSPSHLSSKYVHGVLKDMLNATNQAIQRKLNQIPFHLRAYRAHHMVSELVSAVLQKQQSVESLPDPGSDGTHLAAQALSMLPASCVLGIAPIGIRALISAAKAHGDVASLASVLLAVHRAPTQMSYNLIEALDIDLDDLLRILDYLAEDQRVEDVELLAKHVPPFDAVPEATKQSVIAIFARAGLRDEAEAAYRQIPANSALSPECMLSLIRMWGPSDLAEDIYRQHLEQLANASDLSPTHLLLLAEAALILNLKEDSVAFLRQANMGEFKQQEMKAVLLRLCKTDPRLAVDYLRGFCLPVGQKRDLAVEEDPILSLLPSRGSATFATTVAEIIFEELWKAGEIEFAEEVFSFAARQDLPLPIKDHPFALLRHFALDKSANLIKELGDVATPDLVLDNAGALNWAAQQYACNLYLLSGLGSSYYAPDGQTPKRDIEAMKLLHDPNDANLQHAIDIFFILGKVAGVVDLSTVQLLLFRLRQKGITISTRGHGAKRREQWIKDVDLILDICRNVGMLLPNLGIAARLRATALPDSVPVTIPPPVSLAAAATYKAFDHEDGLRFLVNSGLSREEIEAHLRHVGSTGKEM